MDAASAWRDERSSGLPKILLIDKLLHLRAERPRSFGPGGAYEPLEVADDRAIAFVRGGDVAVVVPRLSLRGQSPTAVVLLPGELHDVLSDFPVAVSSRVMSDEARVEVWAHRADSVEIVVGGEAGPLRGEGGGWFASSPLAFGTDYAFRLDGGDPRPDHGPRAALRRPRSLPAVGSGAVPLVRHGLAWHRPRRRGRLRAARGTFSQEGTFDGVVAHLDHLVELGVSIVELMPVAEFPGGRGWGYDGSTSSLPTMRTADRKASTGSRRSTRPRPRGDARRRLQPSRT